MKKSNSFIITAMCALSLFAVSCATNNDNSKVITTNIPERPEGQTDMVAFAADPIDTVRVGFIGLGMRGPGAVERFTQIPGTKIVALCDIETERVDSAQQILRRAGLPDAATYSGSDTAWRALVERPDLDLIYIATDWKNHAPMGVYAMEQGKHVAIEVPAAMNLDEIWSLINTSEKTRKHCMQLENCVYDFFEMNTLNMAQKGLFGEPVHVEGSYIHNLEPFWKEYYANWRLDYNQKNRGDVYPTHGMGPACQLLNIHRGDRMTTLVSMDSDPFTGPSYVEKVTGEKTDSFANGDHTMTMIRTANGKTIHIQHDVMNPRPYSRMYQITGTKGFANKYPNAGYAFEADALPEGSKIDHENLNAHRYLNQEQKEALLEEYTHPIVKEIGELAKSVGGHGGMDFIMDYRLVYCLRNGLPLDMDVYDLAEWCSLAPLSAISIENGSAPVEVPDFTRGAWQKVDGFKHAMVQE
ncbi:MAG: Gfo/Idh/MocA family oxidoreductase [Muribaculum sp.]|nr:Gfo/Idh/MocA family oxidoreductase [Muribaculaceae bacterium]MCM1081437.1 Gfo/Idh/MocA family oxidoreductase [Muribaculum sp.]